MIVELGPEMSIGIIYQRFDCLDFGLALRLRPAIDVGSWIIACANIIVDTASIRAIVRAGRVVLQSPLIFVVAIQIDAYR